MAAPSRIRFDSFRLIGLPFFKEQSFDLNRKGVSLVLGKNFDSSNQNTNAAGKSLFFAELAEMVSRRPIIGERGDTIRKGARELCFHKKGHDYKVIRSFSPREKIQIFCDGKDLEYKDLAVAEEKLAELIPYTEQEVKSLLLIDSRVPHPLVRGSSAQRREFFLRFFKMNAAPSMRKVVKAELDKISASTGSLQELDRQISALRRKIDGRDPEELQAKLVKLEGKATKLTAVVREYSDVRRTHLDYQEARARLRDLKAIGVNSLADLKARRKATGKSLEEAQTRVQAWKFYLEAVEVAAHAASEIEMIRKAIPEKYLEDPKAAAAKLDKRVDALIEYNSALQKDINGWEAEMEEVSEEAQTRIAQRLVKAQASVKELRVAKGKCPTCGGEFDNRHAAEELAVAEDRVARLEKELSGMEKTRKRVTLRLDEARVTIRESKSIKDKAEGHLLDLNKLNRLQIPSRLEQPEGSLDEARGQVTALKADLQLLEDADSALAAKDAWAELDERQRALAKGDDPTDQLLKTSEQLGSLRSDLEELKESIASYKELRANKKNLTELVAEKPALELLLEAFSKGGIDSLMIRAVCDRLGQLVNRYAKHVFLEDYTFSFELETQFSFLVTRKYGKRTETSDVRKLSGAESLLFNLVLFVALLSFVPESRRSNLLILDEPTAAFGPEMVDSFVKFLPILNSVVPHIVVVTPLPYSDYPGAKVWTVVKKNGTSEFFEGKDIALEKVHATRSSRTAAAKSAGSATRRRPAGVNRRKSNVS